MINVFSFSFSIFYIFLIIGCKGLGSNKSNTNKLISSNKVVKNRDSFLLTETFNQDDKIYNDFFLHRLKPIRQNFKRINSVSKWDRIIQKDIFFTNEGGIVKFYFKKGELEKISTQNFGESFQILTEYYLLKGKLSFVFEKLYRYNRPIYHDSIAMIKMKDTEIFDFNKSEIKELRSYFDKEELFHQIDNQDCGSPFAKEYLFDEQKRILTDFNELMNLQ